MRLGFALLILCLLNSSLLGQIEFSNSPLELHPKPEQETVTATFSFKNTSAKSIELGEVETSCSCLSASTNQSIYAPGEVGHGQATFKISSFLGRQEKSIYLTYKDKSLPKTELVVIIDIPVVIQITPKTLEWVVDSPPTPQSFDIKITTEDPIHITGTESTRDFVTHELITIEAGRHYQVKLTPTSTEKRGIGAIKIQTDSPIKKYNRQMAFFNIISEELAARRAAAAAEKSTNP